MGEEMDGIDKTQEFIDFFTKATGFEPYPYQTRLAIEEPMPDVLHIPTGLGKTEAVVMAWLWRRRFANKTTREDMPRRLVYCLPMRVLVEQTRDRIAGILENIGILAACPSDDRPVSGFAAQNDPDSQRIAVSVLMGGEDFDEWDRYPERDAILIGTQDMLLSRALNRGYAMSRFRWPVQFALLNNDVLWVMDEVQLMGNGLATTAQLHAFRDKFKTVLPARSLWMSATLNPESLHTVDFDSGSLKLGSLNSQDLAQTAVQTRRNASKQLIAPIDATKDGADEIDFLLENHDPGTLSLMVVNTVDRAQTLFKRLKIQLKKYKPVQNHEDARETSSSDLPAQEFVMPEIVLIHSRFRPEDRQQHVDMLLAKPGDGGTIAITTQVVEAGVDVSARLLVTDLAPWSSMVQRFGRCNRKGEFQDAKVCVVDPLTPLPYEEDELNVAKKRLQALSNVGPASLPDTDDPLDYLHVLRRKDMVELFDTTPDLAGMDIDISRFIREQNEYDVQVFWREFIKNQNEPDPDAPGPSRNELCSVPISKLKKGKRDMWRWDPMEREWVKPETLYPGLILMLRADEGGYAPDLGWDGRTKPTGPVQQVQKMENEAMDDDRYAANRSWQTLAEHTDRVVNALDAILRDLSQQFDFIDELRLAARWHDAGKAHEIFQEAMLGEPPQNVNNKIWAKTARPYREVKYKRRGFRHELASAIAILENVRTGNLAFNGLTDLVAYLAATHHGKVRLSIRSMPNEKMPDDPNRRFARGIWDDNKLPSADLGGGVTMPKTVMKLNYMEIGEDDETGPSWLERTLKLRDELGLFRLAFLEALLRVADWRGSANSDQTGGNEVTQ